MKEEGGGGGFKVVIGIVEYIYVLVIWLWWKLRCWILYVDIIIKLEMIMICCCIFGDKLFEFFLICYIDLNCL